MCLNKIESNKQLTLKLLMLQIYLVKRCKSNIPNVLFSYKFLPSSQRCIFFFVFLENILFNIIFIAPCMYACLLLMTYQLLQKKHQSILNIQNKKKIQLKLVGKIPKQIFRFKILILLCLNSFSSCWMNSCRFYSTMCFLHTFQWIVIASLTMFSGIECSRLLAFLFWEKKTYIDDFCMIFVHCVSNMLCSVFKLKMKILVLFLFLK